MTESVCRCIMFIFIFGLCRFHRKSNTMRCYDINDYMTLSVLYLHVLDDSFVVTERIKAKTCNIRLYRIRKDIIKTDIFHSFFYGDLVQIIYMFKSEISRLIAYIRVFIVYVYCGKPQTASVV
jgi:hypothetical protein